MSLREWLSFGRAPSAGALTFESAAVTDCGLVRPENQDSYRILPGGTCFCVADGMGGGQGGALASRWTCEALAESLSGCLANSLDDLRPRVDSSLAKANDRIREYAEEMGFRMMGSTAAILLVDGRDSTRGAICHIGDSRVYRLRGGVLRQLTRDHTVGAAMSRVADGEEAQALGSRRNPLTHVLTRAVGTEPFVRPEWNDVDIAAGDRFLVCSDGVHDMLSDGEISSAMLMGRTPNGAAPILRERIVAAGAVDNFTFICVSANN